MGTLFIDIIRREAKEAGTSFTFPYFQYGCIVEIGPIWVGPLLTLGSPRSLQPMTPK